MKQALAFVIAVFFATFSMAEGTPETLDEQVFVSGDVDDLGKFLWKNRVVIVFAESENDPRFVEQMRLLAQAPGELAERDIIVVSDTSGAAESALRERFHPRGFMMMLIGKDGQVYLRKPLPWNLREITRSVDKLPLRQQEVRDRR